jgi:hypothetical protein
MTYILDNIPDYLDRALRERAAAEHKSPESIIVDLVASGLNAPSQSARSTEMRSNHVSHWREDHEFEAALREQGLIDWEAWSDGVKRRDLTGIAGQHLITPEMKEVFAEQRRIDPELWK